MKKPTKDKTTANGNSLNLTKDCAGVNSLTIILGLTPQTQQPRATL
jgi:hypothetical protein